MKCFVAMNNEKSALQGGEKKYEKAFRRDK